VRLAVDATACVGVNLTPMVQVLGFVGVPPAKVVRQEPPERENGDGMEMAMLFSCALSVFDSVTV
jgi:hypothetical protein